MGQSPRQADRQAQPARNNAAPMFGLLNVHKPSGPTSRRIVDRIERLVRPHKAGHAGTLDPLASGVLVLCIGPATRLIPFVQQQRKRYSATFQLGLTSPTEDTQGEVRSVPGAPIPTQAEVLAAARRLAQSALQRPPIYSALKVAGRRAYALARAGETVELKPRPIVLYRLEVVAYRYPQLELEIECSAGTYVRSLGRDLAESLGTGAVMSALVRTAVGPFTLDKAVAVENLSAESLASALENPLAAVGHLPRLALTDEQVACVHQGRAIENPLAGELQEIAAVDSRGQLVALLIPADGGMLRPRRCFLAGGE